MTETPRLLRTEWEVRETTLPVARDLVTKYHYSKGGSNTRVHVHGLFKKGSSECLGVAWWLPPTKSAALATYPQDWKGVPALSRLVIVPEVPSNACSFLLSRSVRLIDSKRWPCLVTYADTWRGHTGSIYKASNWSYVGMTKPEPTYILNGVMTSRKAGPKTRTHSDMLTLGAKFVGKHAKHKYVMIRGTK